jgi:hypothetical protein
MTTKPQETHYLPETLRPGRFPLGSPESRAAARAMLNAWEAEGDAINCHIGIIGFGGDPDCSCRACRLKWSKCAPEEHAAARLSLQNYVDRACGGPAIESDRSL